MDQLSSRDAAILNCVFNPNLPLDNALSYQTLEDEEEQGNPNVVQAKKFEIEAKKLAENGDYEKALNILNEALILAPYKASLYNNRGQVLQYLGKFEDAMKDLNEAINLSKNTKLLKTSCRAHTQRGILFRRKGDTEKAKEDFEIAAKMGDIFAKNQLVDLNPYAALCNQMLRKVMETQE